MNCNIIKLPKISDRRGSITFIEGQKHIPFEIKRVFYLYDLKNTRGKHAHKKCEQVFIASAGSFEIIADDGKTKETHKLDRPDMALYASNLVWTELKNFSKNAVCTVLCSESYSEDDYIRDYDDFMRAVS